MSIPTPEMIQAIADLSRTFPELTEKIFKDTYDAPDLDGAQMVVSLWQQNLISNEKAKAVANYLADHYLKAHKIKFKDPTS